MITAKQYLSQVYWLEMQVESKLMQEKELRSLAERVGMNMDRTAGARGGNPSGREEIRSLSSIPDPEGLSG